MAARNEEQVKRENTAESPGTRIDESWRNHPNIDMITNFVTKMRDCQFYKDEFKECTSYHGRFRQRYIYGESLDCNHFNNAYKYCKMAQNDNNQGAQDFVVRYELAKRDYRISDALANNVWEYRKSPPESWNYPGQDRHTIEGIDENSEPTSVQANEAKGSLTSLNSNTKGDNQLTSEQTLERTETKSSSGCVIS